MILVNLNTLALCSCEGDLAFYVSALQDCLPRIPPNSLSKVYADFSDIAPHMQSFFSQVMGSISFSPKHSNHSLVCSIGLCLHSFSLDVNPQVCHVFFPLFCIICCISPSMIYISSCKYH